MAELRELERELVPGSSASAAFRADHEAVVELARALEVRTPDEFRAAVAAGRLQSVPGVGPKFEARVWRRSRASPRRRAGCCSARRARS